MAEDVKPTVQVRTARVDDGAGIAAVYRPYVDASVASFETDPPDAAEMTRRLSAHPSLPWLVAVGPPTSSSASPTRLRTGPGRRTAGRWRRPFTCPSRGKELVGC